MNKASDVVRRRSYPDQVGVWGVNIDDDGDNVEEIEVMENEGGELVVFALDLEDFGFDLTQAEVCESDTEYVLASSLLLRDGAEAWIYLS